MIVRVLISYRRVFHIEWRSLILTAAFYDENLFLARIERLQVWIQLS